jgi:hypothetical protein
VDDTVGTSVTGYAQAVLCAGLVVVLPREALPHQGLFVAFLAIQAAVGLVVGFTTQFLADEALRSYHVMLRTSLLGFHAGFALKAWLAVAILAQVWPTTEVALVLVALLAAAGVYGAVRVDRRVIGVMFLLPDAAFVAATGLLLARSAAVGTPWAGWGLLTASGLASLGGTLTFLVLQPMCRGKDNPRNPLPEQFNHNAVFHAIWMVSFVLLFASARSTF